MDKETAVSVGKYAAAIVGGLGVGYLVATKLGGRVNRRQALDTDKIVHQVSSRGKIKIFVWDIENVIGLK